MPKRRLVAVGLAILAVVALSHAGALNNSFHYDDVHSVVDNPHIRTLSEPLALLADPATFSARPERAMFRPLVVLSYALTHAAAGPVPAAHVFINVVAHLVAVCLVFALALSFGASIMAAAGAALLFGLHPVNAEVVNYVSSRSESFAAVGMLVALVAWQRSPSDWRWQGTGLVGFMLALLAKATAVALPIMLLVRRQLTAVGRRSLWMLAPYAAATVCYVWVVSTFAGKALGAPVRPLSAQICTQLKAVAWYARLLVMPAGLSVEHDFTVSTHPATAPVLLALALSASLIWVLWTVGTQRQRMLAAWAVLAIAPASLVPLNVLVNEHRLYLASACLAILLAIVMGRAMRRSSLLQAVAGMVLVLLVVLSWQRSQVWDSERSLWHDAVERAPNAYRAHMHYGGALEADGDLAAALGHYRIAATLQPDVAETHYNLGNALRLTGQPAKARLSWERSLQQDPAYVDALLNLAASYQDEGDWDQVWSLLGRAEAAQPGSAEIWRRKGVALRLTGDVEGAQRAYERALELNPYRGEIHYNLANLHYAQGRTAAAASQYEQALQIEPAHHGAAFNLADLRLRAGDPAKAERVCRRVLKLDVLRHAPGRSKLYYLLAMALEQQGKRLEALANYRTYLASPSGHPAARATAQQRIEYLESIQRQAR